MRRIALIAALILASCAGEGQTTSTIEAGPTLTTLSAVETTTTEAAPTTAPPETTTTAPPTTTTLPPNAAPAFGLSLVVFGESSFVVVTNWGNDRGSLDGYWLSHGAAAGPLPDVVLAPGEQALIGLAADEAPALAGMAATIDLGPAVGLLSATAGEIGLHASEVLDDADQLVAYVAWGDGPYFRLDLATNAGLWAGDPVVIFDDAPSISSGVYPAIANTDWSVDIGG